ncbi:hypothetical protein [Jiulongibacter sp. NS-SX5]|uniref:hypothetical protein n=1 Tax=Jiulongibacter sp. NS-SX5 TaxID=3463854 RepID=UPI0040595730
MIKYDNVANGVMVSHDEAGILKFLERKGETIEKIKAKGVHVDTYFNEDDLMLVIYDDRTEEKEVTLICIQDFYINTNSVVEIHDGFKAKTKDLANVNAYRMAVEKLAHIITMIPTFQEYYYQYNLAYPSKTSMPSPYEIQMEKAA